MSTKDTITKNYMKDNAIFADAFNFLIYGGKQVIKPEQLKDVDLTEMGFSEDDEYSVLSPEYKDLLDTIAAKTDGKLIYYLIPCTENQPELYYTMPEKSRLLVAEGYNAQIEKTNQLLPIIALTVYFSAEEWTASRTLHDMFSKNIPQRVLQFVPEYNVSLIAPAEIPDENFSKFQTELRIVLEYIKNSNDKEKLRKLVQENHAYRNVSKKTVDLVNTMTNSNLQYPEREENVDMCKAIEGMLEDSRQEGKIEGKQEGILEAFLSLVKEGILTIEDAAKRADMTVEEFTAKTSAM